MTTHNTITLCSAALFFFQFSSTYHSLYVRYVPSIVCRWNGMSIFHAHFISVYAQHPNKNTFGYYYPPHNYTNTTAANNNDSSVECRDVRSSEIVSLILVRWLLLLLSTQNKIALKNRFSGIRLSLSPLSLKPFQFPIYFHFFPYQNVMMVYVLRVCLWRSSVSVAVAVRVHDNAFRLWNNPKHGKSIFLSLLILSIITMPLTLRLLMMTTILSDKNESEIKCEWRGRASKSESKRAEIKKWYWCELLMMVSREFVLGDDELGDRMALPFGLSLALPRLHSANDSDMVK